MCKHVTEIKTDPFCIWKNVFADWGDLEQVGCFTRNQPVESINKAWQKKYSKFIAT